jgi:hypothetical protein
MPRWIVGSLLSGLLILMAFGSVAAAPANRFTFEVDAQCEGITETLLLTAQSGSAGHVFYVADSTRRLVYVSVTGTVTVDGEPVPFAFTPNGKFTGLGDDPLTCTVQDTYISPRSGATVVFDLILVGLLTPRGS